MSGEQILRNLGGTVRSLRKARRWSRRELAARAGLSERFLADVETGRANPSVLRLSELATALDITVVGLLGGPQERHAERRAVALLGLRGAGKSTIGPRVAAQMRRPFVELDEVVERSAGLSLGELFQVHGEAYYRRLERQALERTLAADPDCVIAAGGGLVTEPATYALLRGAAHTFWLRARPEDHWQRVIAQGDVRPMADNERAFSDLRRILAEREPLYRQAEHVIDTSARDVEAVVTEIVRLCGTGQQPVGNEQRGS